MMMNLLLLDVRPDPPTAALGIGILIVLILAILIISAALIGGFVFLMMRRKKRNQAQPAQLVSDMSSS
jgi:preprotein translocase subunit YajC